ncbi:MAG TPA: hypothetical protein VK951_05340, partial [Miltoncostaeaceae bacterium]|nr:hypothetical protein [Miltoncostaeaceae bacterium]
MSTVKPPDIDLGQYKFGWHDPANYVFEPKRGLNADVVREISADLAIGPDGRAVAVSATGEALR